MSRSGITRWCGRFTFSFLRSLSTDAQRGCTSLHSQQQQMRVSLHNLTSICFQLFCWPWLFWLWWNQESQNSFNLHLWIVKDNEHFVRCLLTIFISSIENSVWTPSIGLSVSLTLHCWFVVYSGYESSVICISGKESLPLCVFLLHLIIFLALQKLFSFLRAPVVNCWP